MVNLKKFSLKDNITDIVSAPDVYYRNHHKTKYDFT